VKTSVYKIFEQDLFLAKCFIIVESVDQNILNTIRLLGVRIVQAIFNSDAVKNSKILKLKNASKILNLYIQRSFAIKDNPDILVFRERAGKLVASIEFLFLLEDLSTILSKENETITKIFIERQNQKSAALDNANDISIQSLIATNDNNMKISNNITTIGTEEQIQDPSLEILLGSRESKNMIARILKVLNKQNQITKDPATIKFKNVVNKLKNNNYAILLPNDFRPTSVDITKLTYSQFQNFIKILQSFSPVISKIRLAIGSSTPIEIKKNLLGEPIK
jgi:hypothetical protein